MERNFERLTHVAIFDAHTIIEAGARDCKESVLFSQAYPHAEIYAFECNSETLPACRARAKGRIHLIEKALSDKTGMVAFYPIDTERTVAGTDGSPGASSMFKLRLAVSGSSIKTRIKFMLGRLHEIYYQREVMVDSLTLEGFMKKEHIDTIDILWLDAQGSELSILRGLGERIRDVLYIHTEVEFDEMYQGQPLFKEVDAFLLSHGFRFLEFTDRSKSFGDALYISTDPKMIQHT